MDEAEGDKKMVKGGTNGHDSLSVSSSFEERNKKSGLPGIFGFLFSPPGIVLMFFAVNYPWIKTLVFGSSTSLSPGVAPTTASSPVPVSLKAAKSATSTKASASSNSADPWKVSPACQNPIKKVFDRNCRQEIKRIRLERKREKMRLQKERRERRQRRQREKNPQSFANATVTPKIEIVDTKTSTSKVKLAAAPPVKIVNVNNFECNNILSRECRQKKRLMQQMKEALNN